LGHPIPLTGEEDGSVLRLILAKEFTDLFIKPLDILLAFSRTTGPVYDSISHLDSLAMPHMYLRPQIEGKTSKFANSGRMHLTSYSESSGLLTQALAPAQRMYAPDLREIKIGFPRQDQNLSSNRVKRLFEVTVICRLL